MAFDQAIFDKVCALMGEGLSVRAALRSDPSFPTIGVFHGWATAHAFPERFEQYGRAREAQALALVAEIIDVAKDGSRDTYVDQDGNEKVNTEVVQRSRLIIDTLKWNASKILPKVYGEKITQEVTGKDGAPLIPTLSVTISRE